MIKFNKDVTLTIVENFDETLDAITEETVETFKAGEIVDADVVASNFHKGDEYCDLQFASSGGVAFGVLKVNFEVL